MANSPRISSAAASTMMDLLGSKMNSALLRVYSGTQPATVDTAPTTAEVMLANLAFGATAFGASSSGIAAANAITSTTACPGTGTATWYRVFAGGTTAGAAVHDGSVGTATADLILNSVAISSGASVSVSSFQLTMPKTS